MTSSLHSAGPEVAEPRTNGRAQRWAWTDLEATGPEAEAARLEEERHRREVEEAYRRGLTEGEDAGARMARNELRVAMSATKEALAEIRANREAWEARLQERLIVLAAAMAHQVIQQARDVDPTFFVELATKAVASFPVEEPVRIRLNPVDQAVLTDGGFLEAVVGDRAVRWIPDQDVVPGGCVVEGPDRIVDGRVDEALTRIVLALTYD